jgi:predicted DNA-binding transcriptional regulator AlpA
METTVPQERATLDARLNRAPRALSPLLLTIDEVAALLGVSRRTAYELRGREPHFPRALVLGAGGRSVRYRLADVEAFVAGLGAESAPPREPQQLAAGKARRRTPAGGPAGLLAGLPAAKPRRTRALADGSSVEREKGARN